MPTLVRFECQLWSDLSANFGQIWVPILVQVEHRLSRILASPWLTLSLLASLAGRRFLFFSSFFLFAILFISTFSKFARGHVISLPRLVLIVVCLRAFFVQDDLPSWRWVGLFSLSFSLLFPRDFCFQKASKKKSSPAALLVGPSRPSAQPTAGKRYPRVAETLRSKNFFLLYIRNLTNFETFSAVMVRKIRSSSRQEGSLQSRISTLICGESSGPKTFRSKSTIS